MTDCNPESLHFARSGRKAVVADFHGGRLTTDAGLLLLRELERRLGLVDALDQAIPDPRLPELIVHDQRALLAQRIFAIACGHEDLNDHPAVGRLRLGVTPQRDRCGGPSLVGVRGAVCPKRARHGPACQNPIT